MAGISVTGVGSGIDINSLVEQLVAAERQPTEERLNTREVVFQAQLSGFGLVKSALSDLRNALRSLGDDGLFQQRTATSAEPEVFTATAQDGVAAGAYSVEVEQLATAQRLRSAGFASSDTTVGSGTLSIAANGSSFSVAVTSASLTEVRDAINGAADNTLVSASIVNVDDGLGGTESRLVLSARTAGSDHALTVTADDADGDDTDAGGLSQLVYDPDGTGTTNLIQVDPAGDALVRVDGQAATRSSNIISDLIDGVTLTLQDADPGNPHRLTISENPSAVVSAVDAFVAAFNSFFDTHDAQTAFNPETQEAAALLGDSTMRLLESRLRGAIANPVATSGDLDSLAALGIVTGRDGRLSLDTATLNQALSDNPSGVAAVFSGDDGMVARADALIAGYLDNNGLLDDRIDGLNTRIEDLNAGRADLDRRMAALEARLFSQFSAMDQIVSQLQSTGEFLFQQLDALNSLNER